MRVQAIRLINFMAFEDTGWIELRPITLLFGRNSSGKSAITRALLLLKQSLFGENTRVGPLHFVAENRWVDLGNYATVVHRKAGEMESGNHLDRSMIFGFQCGLNGDPTLDEIKELVKRGSNSLLSTEVIDNISTVELLVGFGWYVDVVKPDLLRVNVQVGETSVSLIECARPNDQEIEQSHVLNSDVVHADNVGDDIVGLHLRNAIGFWTTFAKPMPETLAVLDKILVQIQDSVEEFLKGIVHIGPIRPSPERTYILRQEDKPRFEREGLGGWYDFLRNNIDTQKFDDIVKWTGKLGLALGLEVLADKDSRPAFRSSLMLNEAVNVNLKDTGFGASQVLPVISAAILAQPGALVIIEQPELHLHPAAQANLADLFIDSSHDNTLFLIETHSADLIYRLRRRLAETRQLGMKAQFHLEPEKLLTCFIEQRTNDQLGNSSVVEVVTYDEIGSYIYQPPGFIDFFGSSRDELMAMKSARLAVEEEKSN